MKKNPLVPFGLIALLGIVAMVVMGGVGLSQMDNAEGNGATEQETTSDPAELVQKLSCVNCHGQDLTGTNTAPDLTKVGDKYDMEQLVDIINNGVEGSTLMTGDYANAEQAKLIAEWLLNEKSQ